MYTSLGRQREKFCSAGSCRVIRSAIAIAALLLSSIDEGFRALWPIISRAARYVFTAVAIFDVPYLSPTLNVMDRLTLIETSTYLYGSVVSLFAAWLLSDGYPVLGRFVIDRVQEPIY